MSLIGSLEIQIIAPLAQLMRDMRQAERTVGGGMTTIERSTREATQALSRAERQAAYTGRSMRGAGRESAQAASDFRRASREADGMTQSMRGLGGAFGGMGGGIGAGIGAAIGLDELRRAADAYINLTSRIRMVTDSQLQYADAMEHVRRISANAQADINATGMFLSRVWSITKDMNYEFKNAVSMVETVSYSLKAFGATTAEAGSTMLQLSQAVGSGKLGGEEFRAVMEAAPGLMKILAQSMGVQLGQLRQLSMDSKITTDEMMKAWSDPKIAEEMLKMAKQTKTITGELQVLRNEARLMVGSLMDGTGSINGIGTAISGLTEAFKFLTANMSALVNMATILAALYAGKLLSALVANRIEKSKGIAIENQRLAASFATAQAELQAAKQREEYYRRDFGMADAREKAQRRLTEAIQAEKTAKETLNKSTMILGANTRSVQSEAYEQAKKNTALEKKRFSDYIAGQMDINRKSKEYLEAQRGLRHASDNLAMAERNRIDGTITAMSRLRDFVSANALGLIGLALWGVYEFADHMGWIDKIFNRVKYHRDEILKRAEAGGISKGVIEEAKMLYDERTGAKKSKDELLKKGIDPNALNSFQAMSKEKARLEEELRKYAAGSLTAGAGTKVFNAVTGETTREIEARKEAIALLGDLMKAEEGYQKSLGIKGGKFSASDDLKNLAADPKIAQFNQNVKSLNEQYLKDVDNVRNSKDLSELAKVEAQSELASLYSTAYKQYEATRDKVTGASGGSKAIDDGARAYKQAQDAYENLIKKGLSPGDKIISDMGQHMGKLNETKREHVRLIAYEADELEFLKVINEEVHEQRQFISERDAELSEQRLAGIKAENEKYAELALGAMDVKKSLMTDEQRILSEAGDRWAQYTEMVKAGFLDQADAVRAYVNEFDKNAQMMKDIGKSFQSAFADYLFDPFDKGLKGMVENFSKAILRMKADQASAQLMQMAGNWGAGQSGKSGLMGIIGTGLSMMFGGGAGGADAGGVDASSIGGGFDAVMADTNGAFGDDFIASVGGGYRANGGNVTAGVPYVVGERRPELFVPNQNGYIMPSVPSAQNQQPTVMHVEQHFHFSAPTDTRTRSQVALEAQRGLASAGRIS